MWNWNDLSGHTSAGWLLLEGWQASEGRHTARGGQGQRRVDGGGRLDTGEGKGEGVIEARVSGVNVTLCACGGVLSFRPVEIGLTSACLCLGEEKGTYGCGLKGGVSGPSDEERLGIAHLLLLLQVHIHTTVGPCTIRTRRKGQAWVSPPIA